ncbi:MAG: hypothetical protein ACYTJ0_15715 [Planctomycetota bacterium]
MATIELNRIDELAAQAQKAEADPYTAAHLADVRTRVGKAMEAASVIRN